MKKILLIDDDDLVSKSLARLLSLKGFECAIANNAIDAISKAATNDYDLVISDIRMPGENGIVAVEKIKNIYKEKKVICGFIFLSGYSEEDTPSHAIRLGVSRFLNKPIDNDAFIGSIIEELDLVEKEKAFWKISASPSIQKTKVQDEFASLRKRVVITGIGVISPSGNGKDAYWDGLKSGKNCVDEITLFDATAYPSRMAAEAKHFNPREFISEYTEVKRMGRSSHLAVAAAKLCLEDSKLTNSDIPLLNVCMGSATAGIEYIVPEVINMASGGIRKMRPYLGIAGFGGAISSEVSRAIKSHGPSYTLSTGCTSSTDAMGYALRQIQYGLYDVILTGGADACVDPGILGAFCQMGAVSFRNDKFASRPFNKDRDGFVIAEGSWFFIFEELKHALQRKAKIYAEVVGYGATCDAWHMSKPHPSGEYTALAVQLALADAGLKPEQIDIFEAYGNATTINDSYETGIVKKVFGEHANKLVMPSVKSMLGHPIGAAGAQQVAAALLAINEGVIHPTINYQIPDPECDLDYVANCARKGVFNTAICNSLAFGAKNASIVIRKYCEN